MSLKTEITAAVSFSQLLDTIEELVKRTSMYNPSAWRHFSQHDADRLAGVANCVQRIVNSNPNTCKVCKRVAPLIDGECPNCCH